MRLLVLLLALLGAVPALAQVPANVQATATSGTSVTVTWSAVIGAVGYRVYRDGTQVNQTTNLTFTDNGRTPGTRYSYTVSSVDTVGGESSQSAPAVVTTTNAPGVPTGLSGSAGTNGVALNWTAVSGATSYVIFRDGVEIDTTTTRTYLDTDVEPATTYRYSVASSAGGDDSAKSAEITVTTRGDGSQREAVWTREFERADGNFDEIVTFQEYLVAFPNTLPWVVMRNRFDYSDDDISDDLTVDEYIAHFAGKNIKRPSKAQTFFIADQDGDDLLDPDEYSLTLNRGTKEAVLMKKFDKADKNESGLLSQQEFGIRYGTEE